MPSSCFVRQLATRCEFDSLFAKPRQGAEIWWGERNSCFEAENVLQSQFPLGRTFGVFALCHRGPNRGIHRLGQQTQELPPNTYFFATPLAFSHYSKAMRLPVDRWIAFTSDFPSKIICTVRVYIYICRALQAKGPQKKQK